MNKKLVSLCAVAALVLSVSCKKQEPIAPPPPPPPPVTTEAPKPEIQLNTPPTPESSEKQTDMSFYEEVHDFGTINQGDKVNYFFTFKNSGANDLIIKRALGSCGCTVPEFPKEPIAPGKEAKMKVTFNSTGKSGKVEKSVSVYANVPGGIKVVKIKANILVK